MKLNIQLFATILNEKKSSGGSPYAFYTVTADTSNRTTYGITISGRISSHLQYDSSSLGTGPTMGLNAYLTLNGVEYGPIQLKSTSSGWSGTGVHNTNYSFTISNLSPTQTSIAVAFRVSRTGSAEGNYSKGAALSSTSCDNITFAQGVAQTVFNSISSSTTASVFSINTTSYSGYDVLQIFNGSSIIKTINGITSGTLYSFTSSEQSTLNNLFGASTTSINLTATLTTYTSAGGSSLGSSSKTMTLTLPEYTPTIYLSSYSDNVSTYNTYKNNATDIIKDLSRPNIVITLSNNYNNSYTSATCNGVNGSINGRTVTFTNLPQSSSYAINVRDSRNKLASTTLTGASYTDTIKTVQYFIGGISASVYRPTPTGSTAVVEVVFDVYNGTNLKNLLSENFNFRYTQQGGTQQTVNKNAFSYSSGKYTYTITELDPTKSVSWNVSGTDKINYGISGNSGTLSIGLPVFNAYNKDGTNIFKVNGNEYISGTLNEKKVWSFPAIGQLEGRQYLKLFTISPSAGGNARYVNIRCNVGGWESYRMATLDLQIANRNGLDVKGYYYGYPSAFNRQTLTIWQESDGSHTVYLRNISDYIGSNNIEIVSNGFGDTITYYGTYHPSSEVTGTLAWQSGTDSLSTNLSDLTANRALTATKSEEANYLINNISTQSSAYTTNYIRLGYIETKGFNNNRWDFATLFIQSNFWGNQHNSTDIITLYWTANVNGNRLIIGGNQDRTFYYRVLDNRIYIYVYVAGGNQNGWWTSSVLNLTSGNWVAERLNNVSLENTWVKLEPYNFYQSKPTILYNDATGTSGQITLSESMNTFKYIEVFYVHTGETNPAVKSVKVPAHSSTTIFFKLDAMYDNGTYLYFYSESASIYSNILYRGTKVRWRVAQSGGASTRAVDAGAIVIKRVVGYR